MCSGVFSQLQVKAGEYCCTGTFGRAVFAENFWHHVFVWGMPNGPIHLLILTFVTMMQDLIRFCRYLIFATIILSWVVMFTQSRSPYIEVVQELAEPLLAPFRRIIPNMGMIDLSPILAILALIVIEMIMNQVAIVLLTGL